MLKLRLLVFGVLSLAFLPLRAGAVTQETKVDSIYFADQSDGDNSGAAWKRWLRRHRYIAAQPKLARRLQAQQQQLRRGRVVNYALGEFDKTPLLPQAVKRQPTHLYTLQLASFHQAGALGNWVRDLWLRRRIGQRAVYRTTPKSLRLYASGEMTFKHDPLYVERTADARFTRVFYGVYATQRDANADRRVLERALGTRFLLRRRACTDDLAALVWFSPVAGLDTN